MSRAVGSSTQLLDQVGEVGGQDPVGRREVGDAVGVEHDDVTGVQLGVAGRRRDLVERSQQGAGLADCPGPGRASRRWAVDVRRPWT